MGALYFLIGLFISFLFSAVGWAFKLVFWLIKIIGLMLIKGIPIIAVAIWVVFTEIFGSKKKFKIENNNELEIIDCEFDKEKV